MEAGRWSRLCVDWNDGKKKPDYGEQSSEPLEIVNFISEYTTRCEEDIYHLPVVEKGKKEIVLKNYGFCRQLFEDYKKDRSKNSIITI